MNLYQTLAGKKYKIISVNVQKNLTNRILNLGVFIGAKVFVVKRATKHSPILINCNGLNVALGHGLSKNIEVENE